MTEGINLPPDSWLDSKLLNNKIVTNHHIVYHIVIDWASFIMHRPPSIDKLQLTVFDKLSYLVLLLFSLKIPPHLEELHFDLRKLSL